MRRWLVGLLLLFGLTIPIRMPFFVDALPIRYGTCSGHLLMTCDIWDQQGIVANKFGLVMTHPNPGDRVRIDQAPGYLAKYPVALRLAVHDREGVGWYLSYPPMAFYALYAFLKCFGLGASLQALYAFNLLIDLTCGLLLFRFCLQLGCRPMAAAFASLVYWFNPCTLWFQGIVYAMDMLEQVFWLAFLNVFWAVLRKPDSPRLLGLLGLVNFVSIYTEWLGVFVAAFAFFLCLWRRHWKAAAVLCATSILPGVAYLWQYSWLVGWDTLLDSLKERFLVRSGLTVHQQDGPFQSFQSRWPAMILDYYWRELWPWNLLWLPAFFLAVRNRNIGFVLLLTVLPILVHHRIFYQFTAGHQFSVLKSVVPMALCYALAAERIGRLVWLLAVPGIVMAATFFMSPGYTGKFDEAGDKLAAAVRANAQPDEVVFVAPFTPTQRLWYKARRNCYLFFDHASTAELLRASGLRKAVLITTDELGNLQRVQRFELAPNI